MRFAIVASLLLGAATSLAHPALDTRDPEICCCCDSNTGTVHCKESSDGCICAAVECPPDATTIWDAALPIATAATEKRQETEECCCCDISQPAIVCVDKKPEDCICLAVECPPGSPTQYPEANPPKPTA